MRYQLVLQFPADSLANFDELVDLEATLEEGLSGIAKADGHDFGAGEFNIFILTDDPVGAFRLVEAIIGVRRPIQELKAAYRELEQEKFTILSPPDLERFEVS